MQADVRLLFHELADLSPSERERLLRERRIGPETRAEVESLLIFDHTDGFTNCVSKTAEHALISVAPEHLIQCGPYRLGKLLGSGGMGDVYLAERSDGEIRQQVAVKLLRTGADRPTWRDRFLRERELVASLHHPSIAHAIDAGHTADGRPYLVMEYVDGIAIDLYASELSLRDQLMLFLRVCEAVAHAHRHLIIHRDLKPSNILVDDAGQPKLLDFGIAKLLHEPSEQTQTVERLLTPRYASPEQLRGVVQTTATDVYSLGAVLYKLTTGHSPDETGLAPPKLPSDLGYILRKALRHEPEERYASVDAFANDVRALLEMRPVQARSGDAWYRTRRFLRRYWLPVAAAAITVSGLALGLEVANRERVIAQHRFLEVRRLANKVLALDPLLDGLPGSTKARHEIVAMSQEYLESLAGEVHRDKALAIEVAGAYVSLAQAQGVPAFANLGHYAQADESLKKADAILDPILLSDPRNRTALLTSAEVSRDRMILAESSPRHDEQLALAQKASARLDRFLALGELSPSDKTTAARMFSHFALMAKNRHRFEDSIRYARRAIEISRDLPDNQRPRSSALSIIADSMRFTGDLDGALRNIREARTVLEKAVIPSEMVRLSSFASVLWREGVILGQEESISLGRTDEAIASLQKSLDLSEDWIRNDTHDAAGRIFESQAADELAKLLWRQDPQRALAILDHARVRLGEVPNNAKARIDEARLLAGSSWPLRRLHRGTEAKARIDAAFRSLRETGLYPSHWFDPDSPVEVTLRALGDHQADTGEPLRAAQTYQELLDKYTASKLDPRVDLRYAVKLSRIYAALAGLCRRNGQSDRAEAISALRRQLWQQWDRKLPGNAFVHRQL